MRRFSMRACLGVCGLLALALSAHGQSVHVGTTGHPVGGKGGVNLLHGRLHDDKLTLTHHDQLPNVTRVARIQGKSQALVDLVRNKGVKKGNKTSRYSVGFTEGGKKGNKKSSYSLSFTRGKYRVTTRARVQTVLGHPDDHGRVHRRSGLTHQVSLQLPGADADGLEAVAYFESEAAQQGGGGTILVTLIYQIGHNGEQPVCAMITAQMTVEQLIQLLQGLLPPAEGGGSDPPPDQGM
jgi:hypothetical protein